METIKGTIQKILFSNEESGYRVFVVKTPSGSPTIITGEFGPDMVKGTMADFHGIFKQHPKYGTQFKTASYSITHNVEELSSIRIFIDSISPNIGEERSEAIVKYFGKDTIDILDNTPERLQEVPGIGKVSAESLTESWRKNRETWDKDREIYSMRAFLQSIGLKERRIKRVLGKFGGGMAAEIRIRQNPYILCEVDGFGFTTVDFIARNLGIPESSPDRLKYFIQYMIDVICPDMGHMYLTRSEIPQVISKYCLDTGTKFIEKNELTVEDLDKIFTELSDKLIVDGDAVYSKNCHYYELRSAELLSAMLNAKSDLLFLTKDHIEEFIKHFEMENNIELSPEQKEALYIFGEKKVFVITGGPGTGKTTVLKAIVEMALKERLHLTCMTPTGISAKKLANTINYNAYTIHRRLGFRGKEWTCNESNIYETDVAIIDESSMLDQEVLYRMLAALRNRIHLIFVGDQDQLPSVGAGNVLRELINSREIPVIRLEKIFRQDAASDIIKAAHKIKNGDINLDLFKPDPSADIFFMRMKDPGEIERIITSIATKFKDEKRLFQIIAPKNQGPCSVDQLNNILQQSLNPPSPDLKEINCGSFILRRGDRVMVRKNDYENDIYNGDIGKVIAIGAGKLCITIDERVIELNVDEIRDILRLAYAISAHKAQGQEYPYIILPFINQYGKMLLQRNLLYTAITRAREKVIVIGHGSALEKAINNATVTKRNTKLGERIIECCRKMKKPSSCLPQLEPQEYPIVT